MDKLAAALEHGPGRAAAPQRAGRGRHDPDRGEDPLPGAGGRAAATASARRAAARRRRRAMPGGDSNTTHGEGVRRGIGYGVGYQERRLLRGLRRLLDRARAAVGGGRRAAGRGPHRRRRGRPGARHRAGADRPPRAGRRARAGAARRHAGRLGRLVLGVAPDLHDRRRGEGRVRGACARSSTLPGEASRRARRADRRRADRGDARVPPPADVPARREGPGRRARHVRVRRPSRGRGRRRRARPRARGRDRDRAGRRQGDQPAGGRRARSRAAPRRASGSR